MNQRAEQLYLDMQEDMAHCRHKELGWGVELECLFTICRRYWAVLQKEVAGYEFDNESSEVLFFKTIKPKFISEIIYCGLISHAQLFRSSISDPATLKKFWQQESLRLEKFGSENFDFLEYYKAGGIDRDREWFVRENNELGSFISAGPYDVEAKASTSHDGLVANLQALERYMLFVSEQVNMAEIRDC